MPEGIGYEIPDLQAALEGLFSPPVQLEVTPSKDLLVPEAIREVPAGPLHGVKEGLSLAWNLFSEIGQGVGSRLPTQEQRRAAFEAPVSPFARGSEEAIQDLGDRSRLLSGQAVDVAQGAAEQEGVAEFAAADQAQAVEAQHESDFAALQKQYANERDAELKERKQLYQELATSKLDPMRLYNEASTGRKAIALLGVALGGWLQTSRGGRNAALDTLNRLLDRDLEGQRANLAKKKDLLGEKDKVLATLRQSFGDDQAALLAAKGVQLRQVTLELDKQLASLKDEKALARGLELKAQILKDAEASEAAAGQRATAEADRRFQQKMQRSANALGWARFKAENERYDLELQMRGREAQAKAQAELIKEEKGKPFLYGAESIDPQDVAPDGTSYEGKAPVNRLTTEQRKDAANILSSANDTQHLVKDIEALGTGRNVLPDRKKAIAGAVLARWRLAKQAQVDGIPSDADQRLINAGLGNLENPQEALNLLNDKERLAVLKTVLDMDLRTADTKLAPLGLKRVPVEGVSVVQDAVKQRPRHAVEAAHDLKEASTEPRDVAGTFQDKTGRQSSRGMTSDYNEEAMNLAKSGRDTFSQQMALDTLRKEYQDLATRVRELKEHDPSFNDTANEVQLLGLENAIKVATQRLQTLQGKEHLRKSVQETSRKAFGF